MPPAPPPDPLAPVWGAHQQQQVVPASQLLLNLARTSGHIFHHAEDIHVDVVKQAHMLT